MDISLLKKINDYCWGLPASATEKRGAIRLYGGEQLIQDLDDKVYEQISNVAQLPGLAGPAMTMPDAHWGYGFPIGGVAAFDADAGGIISAGGVGFDISCGIRCLRTNALWHQIQSEREALADALYATIPAGVGVGGKIKLSVAEVDQVLIGGARWALQSGFGIAEDLNYVEEKGQMAGAEPHQVSELAKKRQRKEMGTLGSGNHYLEVQVVEKIYDAEAAAAFALQEGLVLISIHCGSRGLGHQIGSDYLVELYKAAKHLGVYLPDKELACAPIKSDEGQRYIGAMRAGINCALANRQILTHLTRETFSNILPGVLIETLYDVSHNTCKVEKHKINGEMKELFIHRKGATRAFGPGHPHVPLRYRAVGQPVLVGGSMGTASYVLAGTAENEAFASASHGAGRSLSRHAALKRWRGRELIEELQDRGILIRSCSFRGVAEEAPGAYKDVDRVAYDTEKAGLARRVAMLRPKICVKG